MRRVHVFLCILAIAFSGCASQAVTVLRDESFSVSSAGSIACMPFVRGRHCDEIAAGESALLDCAFSSLRYSPEFYSPGALPEISQILHAELSEKFGPGVKNYSASVAVFEVLALRHPDRTLRSLAVDVGKELGVKYVVAGVLDSYAERVGAARGVQSPASVAFRVYLLEVASTATVFEGSFSEAQQSLSENILKAPVFFSRGARWLTAEELSREGIRRILADIP
jgi:hypothetical protein